MPIPLLPSLKEENKIAITKRGEWISNSQNTLANLVDSLKVAANSESQISSIPDVWARPALYEIILLNDKHPLHEKYKQEWRGILAIMALRKLRNFDGIQLQTVDLPEAGKIKDSDPAFLKVVARSLPDTYKKEQNDQTLKAGQSAKIQIITYGHIPLAISWPSILLCPALNLEENRIRDVAWWKQDGINNPLPDLSSDEKNSLYSWIENVINNIQDNDQLMKLLVPYRDDIKRDLGENFVPGYQLNSRAGSSLGITGACSVIDAPIIGIADDSFLDKSNVHLIKRKKSGAKELLILSMDIEKQWNMNASDIIVGGYVTAGAVLPKATGVILDKQRLGDVDLTEYHAEVRMADEFFTDKLAVIYLGINAFPNALNNKVLEYNGAKINVVLPIKKELLNYLDGAYIAKHVSITVVNDGIEAVLELPVSGINGKEKFLIAKKIYKIDSENSEIVEYDTVPLIQVWPNFIFAEADKWKAYYTYYDGCDQYTFYATPVWNQNEKRFIQRHVTDAEIRRGDVFPEAFACAAPVERNSGAEEFLDLGLILLKMPEPQISNSPNKTCKIGIDFGTTNTIAYIAINNDTPEVIQFKDRMFYVANNDPEGLNAIGRQSLRQNFISPSDQPNGSSTSIKTMFHTHYGRLNGDIDQTLFRGNIYYLDDSNNISDDKSILESIHTDDMKWGEAEGIENMQGFLMQLCVQCMAEAVCSGANNVEWTYSYPSSFSKARIRQYQNNWKGRIFKEIQKISSVSVTSPQSQTESDSIAEYFVEDMGATIKRGIICLDIGGGSTDIAVWQGNENTIQNQASLRFAGRNILNDYLWNRQKNSCFLFAQLKNSDAKFNGQLDKLSAVRNKHEFDLQLEAILKYYEQSIFEALPSKCCTADIAAMIRDISFALSGIFFYAGILTGYLRKTGAYKEQELLPNCYVGGNASKLLDWAAEGQFDKDSMINDVFKACFMQGVGVAQTDATYGKVFDIIKTNHPKQEVAYGLVCDSLSGENKKAANSDVIAGEKFIVEKNEHVDADVITAEDILGTVQIDRTCPPVFNKFLKTFNHEMKSMGYETIRLGDKDFINICSTVNQNLVDKCNKANGDEDEIELEPLFIMILKIVFEYLSKK